MLPFVALHGYQFNDTSFGVFSAPSRWRCSTRGSDSCSSARAAAARRREHRARVVLGFGTLFFYCAIRGEVWFAAEVMGVRSPASTRATRWARGGVLAGLFFSMAVTRRRSARCLTRASS